MSYSSHLATEEVKNHIGCVWFLGLAQAWFGDMHDQIKLGLDNASIFCFVGWTKLRLANKVCVRFSALVRIGSPSFRMVSEKNRR